MEENKNDKTNQKEKLDERVIKEVESSIEVILDDGLTNENLDTLYKLVDIHKDIVKERKEKFDMNYGYGNYNGYENYNGYGNYGEYSGRGPSHGAYGEYGRNSYGRRGRDMKYRGEDYLDRMHNEYGRYEESRSRYGAGKESDEAHKYMVESLKDFIKYLNETAETPQQKQMLQEAVQQSMM